MKRKYLTRNIDRNLEQWRDDVNRKPLLLRGARQVGKSSSVRHLAEKFPYFIEVNFEKRPELRRVFEEVSDVKEVARRMGILFSTPVEPGKTLLFLDEIQSCPSAIKSLWFFKEDYPELHVVAAGSLLEFALKDLSSYGVGRVQSMFMYPLSFSEFLNAIGKGGWVDAINEADFDHPLPEELHKELVEQFRIFILVGGMPASVLSWAQGQDFQQCRRELRGIQQSYYDDFAKYSGRLDPMLLRATLGSVALQAGRKFTYSRVAGGYRTEDVKKALMMLVDAGIVREVRHTAANGLPLGAEVNDKFTKYLYLDSGLLLQVLDMDFGGMEEVFGGILSDAAFDLVNKGSLAELIAGWEMVKGHPSDSQPYLFYWANLSTGATSEVDYVTVRKLRIAPIEIKSGTSGKMKSLRTFMENKDVRTGYRSSLENFGRLEFSSGEKQREILILPIYAVGRLVGGRI